MWFDYWFSVCWWRGADLFVGETDNNRQMMTVRATANVFVIDIILSRSTNPRPPPLTMRKSVTLMGDWIGGMVIEWVFYWVRSGWKGAAQRRALNIYCLPNGQAHPSDDLHCHWFQSKCQQHTILVFFSARRRELKAGNGDLLYVNWDSKLMQQMICAQVLGMA